VIKYPAGGNSVHALLKTWREEHSFSIQTDTTCTCVLSSCSIGAEAAALNIRPPEFAKE
jgi:hypothetical protein